MIIGVIGTILLISSYVVLLKTDKIFWEMNAIASFVLLIHAIMIKDLSFILVNGFIGSVCIWKAAKKYGV